MARFSLSAARSAGALVALVPLCALPAAADDLRPHRAIYDLTLSQAEPSTSLVSASGRLAFAVGGSICEGFTLEFRTVTRVSDREGNEQTTDLRSSSKETARPPVLEFSHQTLVDDAPQSQVTGTATARADGTTVEVTEPKTTTLQLPRAIFPTAHTRLIIEAAEAGERILEATVYDGGDDAQTVYETTTVISEGKTGLPGASPTEIAAMEVLPDAAERTAWRLVISYFKPGGAEGERVPEYEITFSMLDNGISYDVAFNYGAFTLAGDLTELMVSDTPSCEE